MDHLTLIRCSNNINIGFLNNLCIILCFFTSLIMKGDKNRRKNKSSGGHFKRGHNTPGPGRPADDRDKPEYVRPNEEEAALLDVDPVMHNALKLEGLEQHTMLLRPRKKPSRKANSEDLRSENNDCYRIFHVNKLLEMINEVNSEHRNAYPKCKSNLTFDKRSEAQRGLCWRERMICLRPKCSYRSKMYNLYTEIKTEKNRPGRRTATANVGINIAMTQTSIGASSIVRLLAGANIEGTSIRGLTKTSRTTRDIIVSENKADMSSRLRNLRNLNKWQGRPDDQIPVQIDGMYNNNLYSGVGRTPFQPATQCTLTVAENITRKRQIVAMETINKVCSKHGFHTQDEEPCDIKAGPCSASASMETNIGDEESWAKSCLTQMSKDGMEVNYVTTDGDGKSFEAARQLHSEGLTKTEPIHQLDTRHLGANHRKFVKSSSKVTAVMPGRTKAYRLFLQNRFALDLSQRCQAELQNIIQGCSGNTNVLKYTRDMISVIKQCYSGNHSLCKTKSFVCKGKVCDNWVKNSTFLPNSFKIDLSREENEETLMDCIQYRLGDDAVLLTKLNSNTQKVEGTNRAIKISLPKDRTFRSTFEARAHSAVHRVNNGPGHSLRKLCNAAGCPIPFGSRVERQLQYMQSQSEKIKKVQGSMAYKIARKIRKQRLYRLYEQQREEKNYVKNQLTRRLNRARKKKAAEPKPSTSYSVSDHDMYARKPDLSRKRKKPTSNKDARGVMTQTSSSNSTLTPPHIIRVILKHKAKTSLNAYWYKITYTIFTILFLLAGFLYLISNSSTKHQVRFKTNIVKQRNKSLKNNIGAKYKFGHPHTLHKVPGSKFKKGIKAVRKQNYKKVKNCTEKFRSNHLMTTRFLGRLGNNIFQLATLLAVAEQTCYKPVRRYRAVVDNTFDIPSIELYKGGLSSARKSEEPGCMIYDKNITSKIQSNFNWTILGYRQSFHYFQNYSKLVRSSLHFKENIKRDVANFLKKEVFKNKTKVCLHVRRRDMLLYLPKQGKTKAGITFINRALNYMKNYLKPKQFSLIVASDDKRWCDWNIKWDHVTSPLKTAGQDMYLLTQCDHNIITHGTFGWMGAWLNESGLVIYSKQYPPKHSMFQKCYIKGHYYPSHWIGL